MDEGIEWHQAQGLPHGGFYRGLDEVRRNVFDPLHDEWWAEFSAEPDEFIDAGDTSSCSAATAAWRNARAAGSTCRTSTSGRCATARPSASGQFLDTQGWNDALG